MLLRLWSRDLTDGGVSRSPANSGLQPTSPRRCVGALEFAGVRRVVAAQPEGRWAGQQL